MYDGLELRALVDIRVDILDYNYTGLPAHESWPGPCQSTVERALGEQVIKSLAGLEGHHQPWPS